MIYGANGYTGALIAAAAAAAGFEPTLAGRSRDALERLAVQLKLRSCAFALADRAAMLTALRGQSVLLNCAGPFVATAEPLAEACLEAGVHYLDLAGEIPAMRAVYACDARVRARGLTFVPGVGCDVVPSNCLVATLAARLPDARELELGCEFETRPSRGTLRSIVRQLPEGSQVVRGGALVRVRHGRYVRKLAGVRRWAIAAPWGDLAAAPRSTGLPNITVYMALPAPLVWAAFAFGSLAPLTRATWLQRAIERAIARLPAGPDEAELASGRLTWWASARAASGAVQHGRIDIADPYRFTIDAALTAVARTLAGDTQRGALTPSEAFGVDFAAALPDTRLSTACSAGV
jgi:short subunit dehydrogenase-like uncharacterized protein